MAITVIMQDSRPDGAGGTYKKGSTYSLPDTLATYFLDIGLVKRTSTRSEQTGATVTGDSAGRFPSAPSQDKSVPLTATISDGGNVFVLAGDSAFCPAVTFISAGDSRDEIKINDALKKNRYFKIISNSVISGPAMPVELSRLWTVVTSR